MRHHLLRIIPYVMLTTSISLSAVAGFAAAPNRPIAAVFPPWWTARHAFTAAASAGAPVVRFGGFANILVLASGSPDLPQRLRHAGAWLLLDAQALGGCTAKI